jgi:hypothetical protein
MSGITVDFIYDVEMNLRHDVFGIFLFVFRALAKKIIVGLDIACKRFVRAADGASDVRKPLLR